MARDPEDLVQDVGLALWQAIRSGRLRGAHAAIAGWLRTTTPRIVSRSSRSACLVAFACGSPYDDADDSIVEPAVLPVLHASEVAPATSAGAYHARVHARPSSLSRLTKTEREVFTLWIKGLAPCEIARRLTLPPGAVRLRLLRARRRIDATESD